MSYPTLEVVLLQNYPRLYGAVSKMAFFEIPASSQPEMVPFIELSLDCR
jgi:hypothetical protein